MSLNWNDRPSDEVVEELYNDLIEEHSAAYVARVRASLEDVKEKRVRRFKNAEELLRAIEKED